VSFLGAGGSAFDLLAGASDCVDGDVCVVDGLVDVERKVELSLVLLCGGVDARVGEDLECNLLSLLAGGEAGGVLPGGMRGPGGTPGQPTAPGTRIGLSSRMFQVKRFMPGEAGRVVGRGAPVLSSDSGLEEKVMTSAPSSSTMSSVTGPSRPSGK
jgi:hypothetical protein